jgi:hypothetical protein
MNRYLHQVGPALTTLTIALTLLTPGAARAAAPTSYTIQPIVHLGDTTGGVNILAGGGDFEIGALNDSGQLVFITEHGKPQGSEMLLQYADGKIHPIVVANRAAPGGQWEGGVEVAGPVSMNQRGDVVFVAKVSVGGQTSWGTFRWDFQAQKVTAVAVKGMPATGDLTFTGAAGSYVPAINNSGEIAFPAIVMSRTPGGASGNALFFLGRDGQLQPVLLPGQELPGGGKLQNNSFRFPEASLADDGRVAFLAHPQGGPLNNAYVWELGTISPVLVSGAALPGGGTIGAVSRVLVNSKNRSVLVAADVAGASSGPGLYLVADGQLTPVAVPGQPMPEGSKLRSLGDVSKTGLGQTIVLGVSAANAVGQYAFVATLEDGGTAAYRIEADGALSLILKSGAVTDLGKITRVGAGARGTGIAINSQGQVAVPVTIDTGPEAIALLTPVPPQ